MTAMEENVDDRFAGIDIDSLLNRSNPRPLNCGRRKALYESPEFIQRLNGEETVLEGQSLVLECKVAGFPVPVLRWFKDDEEIIDHPRIRVEGDGKGTYCLLIDSVHKGDEAAYRCRAENVEGSCSSFFFLSVKAKRRSQKKKKKKDSKSAPKRTVSFPPMFATIVEKVEEEEKQGKELELLPPSPMTDFYYALTLKGRQSWPTFVGDWAFADEDGRERVPPDRALSMSNGSPESGQFRSPGQGRVAARRSMRRGDLARESSKKQKLEEDARTQKEEEEKNKNRIEEEEMRKKNQLIEEKTRQEEREREEEKKREEAMRRRKKLREERVAKQEEEERKKKEQEELTKKKEDEERKRKAEEEEKRRQEEKRREQEALKIEEEKRKAAIQKAKEEERLTEEKKRREAEKQKQETEARNKEIMERKRKAEAKRKEEEAIKEVERRKEEEQRKRDADIAKKKEEQMKLLQQKKKEEELRKQKEADDKRGQLQKAEEDNKKRKEVADASKKLEAKKKEEEQKQMQDRKIKFEHERHLQVRNGKEELDKGKQVDKSANIPQTRPSEQKSVLQRFGKHLDAADQLKSNQSSDLQAKGGPKSNELPGKGKSNVNGPDESIGAVDKAGAVSRPGKPVGVVGLKHPGLHKTGSASDHGPTDRDTKLGVTQDKIIGHDKSKMAVGKANIPNAGEAQVSKRQAGGVSSESSTEQGKKVESQGKDMAKCELTEAQRDLTKQKQELQKKELILKREEEDKKRKELAEKQKRDELLLQKKKEKIRKEQLWRQHEEEERRRMKKEAERMSKKVEEDKEKKKVKLASGDAGIAADEEDEFSVKVYKRDYSFADLRKSLESHLGADVMDPEEHKYWDEILEKHDYSILDLKKTFDTGGVSESSERMSRARVRRNSIELETEIFRVKRSSSITDLRESFTNSLDRPKKKSEAQKKKRQKDEEFLKLAPPLQDLRQQYLEAHKPEPASTESTLTSQSASTKVKPSTKVLSSSLSSSTSSSSSLISSHTPSSSSSSSSSSVSATNISQSSLSTKQPASSVNVSKNVGARTELAKMAGSVASKRASFHEMLSHTNRSQLANAGISDKARKRISYHGYDAYGSREIPAYQRVAAWSDDIGKSRTNANINAGRQDLHSSSSGHQNEEDNDTRVRPFVYNSIRTIARTSTCSLCSDNDARTSDENETQNTELSNDDEDNGPPAKKPYSVLADLKTKDGDDTLPSNEVGALNASSVNSDLEPKDIGQSQLVRRGRRYRRRRDLAAQRALHDQGSASILSDTTLKGNSMQDSSSNHSTNITTGDSNNDSNIAVANVEGQEVDTARSFRPVNVITSGVQSVSTPPIVVEMWDDDVEDKVSFGKTLAREEREPTPFFNDQRLENAGRKLDIRNSRSPRGYDTSKNRSLNTRIESKSNQSSKDSNNLGIDVSKEGGIDRPDLCLPDSRTEFHRALTPIPMLEAEKVPCFSSGFLQLPDNDFSGVRAPRESTPFYEDSSPDTPSSDGSLDSSPAPSRSPSPSPPPYLRSHGHPHNNNYLCDSNQLLSPTHSGVTEYPIPASSVRRDVNAAAAGGDGGNDVGCKDSASHTPDSENQQTGRKKQLHSVTDKKTTSISETKPLSIPEKKPGPPPTLSLSVPEKKLQSLPVDIQHFVPDKKHIFPPDTKVISTASTESISSFSAVLSSEVSKSSPSPVPSTKRQSQEGEGSKDKIIQKEAVMEVARPAIRYGSVERQVIQASPTASCNVKHPTQVDTLKDIQSYPTEKQAGAIDILKTKVLVPEAISKQHVQQLYETKQEVVDTESVLMKAESLNDTSNVKLGPVNQKHVVKQATSNTQTTMKPTADTENAKGRQTTTKVPIKTDSPFSTLKVKETQSREHGKLTLATPRSKTTVGQDTPTGTTTSQLPTLRNTPQFADNIPTGGGVKGRHEAGLAPLDNMATTKLSPTSETVPFQINKTENTPQISDGNTAKGSTPNDVTAHRAQVTPTASPTATPTKTSRMRSPRRTPLCLDTRGGPSRASDSRDNVNKKTTRNLDSNVIASNLNEPKVEAKSEGEILNVRQEKLKHPPPISTSAPSDLFRSRPTDTANPPLSTARPHFSTSRSRQPTSSSTLLGASNSSTSAKESKTPSTSGLKKLSSWIQQKQGHSHRKDNKELVEYGGKQRTPKSKGKEKKKGKLLIEKAKREEEITTIRISRKMLDRCSPFGRYTVEGLGVLFVMTMFCLYVDTPVERFVAYVLACYYVFCVLRVLRLLR